MSDNKTLTVRNDATGKTATIKLQYDDKKQSPMPIVSATEFAQIGVRLYDPGYMNTAAAKSKITFIDGANGILRYRGYAIEDLCEHCSFLDVSYLLLKGELPNKVQSKEWNVEIMSHSMVDENLLAMVKCFRHDGHPMGQLTATMAALSTFYPEANPALSGRDIFKSVELRDKQIARIIAKIPTLAAASYRNFIGRAHNYPDSTGSLSYCENFLMMMDKLSEKNYSVNPKLSKALEVLFILHADHELNCSTAAVRHLGSSGVDPYTALSGGIGALYGPLHGGANEAVIRMLEEIKKVENIPDFLERVKNRKAKLMGFGHRVYKNYDPRAKIIKKYADEVFAIVGASPLMKVAVELERQALQDEFFIKRKLFPNVDFYSGLIYKAMGFPTEMFPVLFAIPRAVGWLAHWQESLLDPEFRIVRPRQVYVGEDLRPFNHKDRDVDCKEKTKEVRAVALRLHSKM